MPPEGVRVDPDGEWLAPVVRGWSSKDDAHAERYLVASNRLTERGGWDDQGLADLLADLERDDTLLGTGYGSSDLGDLLAALAAAEPKPVRTADPEAIPEQPDPVTVPGDVWLLGEHRLICGDAADLDVHDRLIDGHRVDLVLTDPPYGVGIDYGDEVNDTEDAIGALMKAVLPLILRHPVALITPGVPLMWGYPKPAWLLAWVHPAGVGSGPWGFTCLNPVLAYGKDPYLARQLGRRADSLVLATDRHGEDEHPVAKPLAVWEWLLVRGSPAEGETILDPFMGSGTTIIAAERLGRKALGIEVSPRWVDLTCRRFQTYTGIKPIRESSGEPVDFAAT